MAGLHRCLRDMRRTTIPRRRDVALTAPATSPAVNGDLSLTELGQRMRNAANEERRLCPVLFG